MSVNAIDKKIFVGKIVAPHGIRGDVRVQTYTESPMDFQNFDVQSAAFNENDFRFIRMVPNSAIIIAHINGFEDRNAAEKLRGVELFVDRAALPALSNSDEYYQADLIGFTVVRDGEKIGIVAGFQNFGAGDIVELDNGEYVSFVGAIVNIKNREITL